MTRIEPLSPPYSSEVAEDFAKLMPPGMEPLLLFRTVANNPRVLRRMRRGGLLDAGSIAVHDREIVILRATARCRAEYEWGVHVAFFAEAAGLSEAQVAATVLGDANDVVWSPREALVVALVDALHETADVPDTLFERLRAEYSAAQLVELVTLVGQYHHVSFVTNALRLPREPGAPAFPTR